MLVSTWKQIKKIVLLLCSLPLFPIDAGSALAGNEKINIAVATNFLGTVKEIADRYARKTGVRIQYSSAATGILYAQLVNRAPFDLFLAADEKRPALLYEQGICEEPFVYATGRAVVWSIRDDLDEKDDWRKVIQRKDIQRIALANPETAPYGKAAMRAMERNGLYKTLGKLLVYGQNVGQAFQYGWQGIVDLSFTSLSLAKSGYGLKGKTWRIPEAEPVVQKGCVVKNSSNSSSVDDFVAYLTSDQARGILSESGYE